MAILMKNIQEYIKQMKIIQNSLLNFIDFENCEENYENLINILEEKNVRKNEHDLKVFLYMLVRISKDHHRFPQFFDKIEKILLLFKEEINKYYPNKELIKIFQSSKRLLLFLIEEKMIIIDKSNIKDIKFLDNNEKFFFLSKINNDNNNILVFPNKYEEKKKIGENDDYICKLIREDLIEEFITFVKKEDYALNCFIKYSTFETNSFLIKQMDTSLIEYAAFFGSTQIFKYLYKNNIDLKSSLWLYAIHGDDSEIIQILIDNKVKPPYDSYQFCIKESIKCHHNDIAQYIENNLFEKEKEKVNFMHDFDDNTVSYSFHYYNFLFFPNEIAKLFVFYYACKYDYYQIVKYLLEFKNIDPNDHDIFL